MEVILGIDPGSLVTGYGLISIEANKLQYIDSGCIRTRAKDMTQRLKIIYQCLQEIIQQYFPTEAAIEQVFVHANAGSALKLGQARGAAIVAVAENLLPIFEYAARQIKQAVVGSGSADKTQVQHMVKTLLNLPQAPQADAADALAIAICHINMRNNLQLIEQKNEQSKRSRTS